MVRKDTGLKMLLAIVVVASVFLAGVLATGNTVSALEITQYLTITSEPESGDTYRIGEVIDVTLTYNVTMDMPELAAIGISVGNNLRRASIDKERWMLGHIPRGRAHHVSRGGVRIQLHCTSRRFRLRRRQHLGDRFWILQ